MNREVVVAVVCAAVAAAARVPLLWDDGYAPGYDGWYYVLQVRSLLDGAPLFADLSLVWPLLAACGAATGDVVLGNKLAACAFAGWTAGAGVIAGWRWTGSVAAGAAMGMWLATSPLHLGISAEYLKNAAGLALLVTLVAALASERRGLGLVLAIVGLFVHKATGALGIALVAAYLLAAPVAPRRSWWLLVPVAVAGVAWLAFERLSTPGVSRAALFSGVLSPVEAAEAALVHLAPLGLAAASLRPERRRLGISLVAVAALCVAPGLPFGWDLTAWRLLMIGFVGVGATAAAITERLGWPAAGVIAAIGVLSLPSSIAHRAAREPDYAAWAPLLPAIRAAVPPDGRIVAHRGLCGFLWAEGGRRCESFQPVPPWDGWWRVAYGMGDARLAPYGEVIPLVPGYSLLPEPAWQQFRDDHVGRFRLLEDEVNPWQPRPGFAHGPSRTGEER